MPTNQSLASLYQASMNQLLAIKVDFEATPEQVAAATAAIDELNRAWIADVQARYEVRTASLNLLVERLNAVSATLESGPLDGLRDGLREGAAKVRAALHALSRKALGGASTQVADVGAFEHGADLSREAERSEPPGDIPLDAPPAPRAAPGDASPRTDVPPPPRPALAPLATSAAIARPRSQVPPALFEDYSRLFSACLIRPERVAEVNGHLEQLSAHQNEYQRAGDPLGIPWWFVGIVHGLESNYRLDRHLHNGDPLSAPTVHVPEDRPPGWADAHDRSWGASAADALTLQGLETWDDWSVQGTLYQWERYNGLGYRKFHPEVLSPYLWSFSNHYAKGKYVSDGRFDPEAISKQAGAGVILRQLVNTGQVMT